MSSPPVPQKTALGHEEQRTRRTRALGQRHRTILLLVDGRRTLSEVLALAIQAGAATTHLEDLVRDGYIEVPQPEVDTAHGDTGAGELIAASLEIDVPAGPTAADPAGPADPADPADRAVAAVAEEPPPPPPPPPLAPPSPAPAVAAPPPPPQPRAAKVRAAPVISSGPLVPAQRPAESRTAPRVAPPASHEDDDLLGEVRGCLLEAVRLDGASFGSRMNARVRAAGKAGDLINLVWEMERETSHARRSREGLWNLQRARELLGLGNTLVAEDSKPNWPDSE